MDMQEFQNSGEAYRRALGIDGTAGDAQDVPHPFIPTPGEHGCIACGLRETYRQHHKPGIPTVAEVERRVTSRR